MVDDPLVAELRRQRQGNASQTRTEPATSTPPPSDYLIDELRRIRQSSERTSAASTIPMGKGTAAAVALLSGIPGAEAIGGGFSLLRGGTYQSGRQAVGSTQQRARESIGAIPYEGLRIAPEVTAMALAPVTLAPRLLGTIGGRAALAGGVEAVRGASRVGMENEEAPTIGETAAAAGRGFGYGTVGSFLGEKLVAGGIGLLSGGKNLASRAAGSQSPTMVPGTGILPRAQQFASDLLRRGGMTQAADIIEPIAAPRVGRVLSETLPPRESVTAIRFAQQKATEVAQQAQRAFTQAQRTAREAVVNADAAVRNWIGSRGGQSADPNWLRESLRNAQRTQGDESYAKAFELAEGVDLAPVIPVLSRVVRRNKDVAQAYQNASRVGKTSEIVPDELEVPDLATMDRMRQEVSERVQAYYRGDPTGLSRTKAKEALTEINALEDSYLTTIANKVGPEARTALLDARGQYRAFFEQMEALADGRNLGRFGFGKKEGVITPSRLNIEQLEGAVREMVPEARDAFRIGAREYVEDVLRRSPEDARKMAQNLVGTEERFRRTALALGEDSANELRVLYRDVASARQAQARIRSTGAQPEARLAAGEARRLTSNMALAQRALTNPDAAAGFASSVLPTLNRSQRETAGRVMALQIDDELSRLIGESNGAAKVIARIGELRGNPAARAILGDALTEAERRLRQGVPLRRPVGAVLGGSFGQEIGNP